MLSVVCLGGVKGEERGSVLLARLAVRVRGDGVSGIRPPAVRVEKMPWWLLRGVDTEAVAILQYQMCDRTDNLMYRSFCCVSSSQLTSEMFVNGRWGTSGLWRDPKSLKLMDPGNVC